MWCNSRRRGRIDPIRGAYLRQGVPNWNEVHPAEMREREKHKRAYIALGVAAAAFAGAVFLDQRHVGQCPGAHPQSVFLARAHHRRAYPQRLAGRRGVRQRQSADHLADRRRAGAGQAVSVDIWPADDKSYSVNLGQLAGGGAEDFSYMVPKVDADLDYRVRAGDAASDRFHIKSTSPLSYAHIDVTVTPPKGFDAPVQRLNGLTDQIVVPAGSRLDLAVTGQPAAGAQFHVHGRARRWSSSNPPTTARPTPARMTITQDGAVLITSDADERGESHGFHARPTCAGPASGRAHYFAGGPWRPRRGRGAGHPV